MSDLAITYGEAYCVINSLDPANEEDWETAMDWVTSHSFLECANYVKEHY